MAFRFISMRPQVEASSVATLEVATNFDITDYAVMSPYVFKVSDRISETLNSVISNIEITERRLSDGRTANKVFAICKDGKRLLCNLYGTDKKTVPAGIYPANGTLEFGHCYEDGETVCDIKEVSGTIKKVPRLYVDYRSVIGK